jgi:hypothetical protein
VDDTGPEPPVWKGGIQAFTATPTPTITATGTPTDTPTSTPTNTPTVTGTPTVTATPTPTPLVYDVNGDGIVDANDISLVMWDWVHDPMAERSNFDGEGEIDHRDIFLFSQWWGYRNEDR